MPQLDINKSIKRSDSFAIIFWTFSGFAIVVVILGMLLLGGLVPAPLNVKELMHRLGVTEMQWSWGDSVSASASHKYEDHNEVRRQSGTIKDHGEKESDSDGKKANKSGQDDKETKESHEKKESKKSKSGEDGDGESKTDNKKEE